MDGLSALSACDYLLTSALQLESITKTGIRTNTRSSQGMAPPWSDNFRE